LLIPLATTNSTTTCISDSHIPLPFRDAYPQVNNSRFCVFVRLRTNIPALYQLQNYDSFLNLNILSIFSRFTRISRHLSALSGR
jgi:hypothetical protein